MQYSSYNGISFIETKYFKKLPIEQKNEFTILTKIFHFKVNNYVLEQLIDWDNIPNDPMYRLVFPRKEMLNISDYNQLKQLCDTDDKSNLSQYIQLLQQKYLPQIKHTKLAVAIENGNVLTGVYRNSEKIINLCPTPMVRTCHAYCSYCFRWLIFGNNQIQETSSYNEPQYPINYIKNHPEISDVLFTGADPLVCKSDILQKYIAPILDIESVKVIRISSKSLAWWPHRFTSDNDADNLLRLFEQIQKKGKHLNFCAHFTHPRELESDVVIKAIHRIRNTGAIIRSQGPLIQGVNDSSNDWSQMWNKQISLGIIPYYFFIEANHNPENCFRVPLIKALHIFQNALKQSSPLARTARGPVFMNDIFRVLLDGVIEINKDKYFVLKNLQSPPGIENEGEIKLIPYNETSKYIDNLFELFHPSTLNI